jgi:hypothetical protein
MLGASHGWPVVLAIDGRSLAGCGQTNGRTVTK